MRIRYRNRRHNIRYHFHPFDFLLIYIMNYIPSKTSLPGILHTMYSRPKCLLIHKKWAWANQGIKPEYFFDFVLNVIIYHVDCGGRELN